MNFAKVNNYCYDWKSNNSDFMRHNPITKLKIIYEPEEVDFAVREIYQKCQTFPVIGVDCEWTPVRVKNQKPDVALLQIATKDGYCALFRTCFMVEFPISLLKLMADSNILKVGVGIYSDGEFLKDKFPGIEMNSRFDIRYFTRFCNIFSKNESLKELTKAILPFELQKDNVLSYKWERTYLEEEMTKYAALDALAGVMIFEKLLPLFHEQESDEPFNKIPALQLIQKYFFSRDSPLFVFLDRKC